MNERELFATFGNECRWVWTLWDQFKQLFENGEVRLSLFETVASKHFHFLHDVLREYSLLQCSRLTDPAKTFGTRPNLSAEYLVENIAWPSDIKDALSGKLEELREFTAYIKPARNKLIAHNDLNSRLAKGRLGGFPPGADEKFFADLQEFVSIAHEYLIGGAYPIQSTSYGDATDLVEILKRGVVFKEMFPENRLRFHEALQSSPFAGA